MFSKSCEYAIRAIIFICSKKGSDKIVKIQEIAAAVDAPLSYTSKILQALARQNIIGSAKGPNGGFYIDKQYKKIKLIDIVQAIDGDKIFTGCALGIKQCSEKNPCPLHNDFKKIRENIKKMLELTTVEKLSNKLLNGLTTLKNSR
jgi:Rrf2 family protein